MPQLMPEGDPYVTTYVFVAFVAIILAHIVFGPYSKEGSKKNGDVTADGNPDLFGSRTLDHD